MRRTPGGAQHKAEVIRLESVLRQTEARLQAKGEMERRAREEKEGVEELLVQVLSPACWVA